MKVQTSIITDAISGHTTAPSLPQKSRLAVRPASFSNTYESRRGSHVILEFADPTAGSKASTNSLFSTPRPAGPYRTQSQTLEQRSAPEVASSASRSVSWTGVPSTAGWSQRSPTELPRQVQNRLISPAPSNDGSITPAARSPPIQTRLQATFEAFKKMGSGLTSPRVDAVPRRKSPASTSLSSATTLEEDDGPPGYFDVEVEG